MKLLERLGLLIPILLMSALLIWLGHAGATRLSLSFLIEAPKNAGLSGGIGPILGNTFIIVGLALTIAVPVALAAAIAHNGARPRRHGIKGRVLTTARQIVDVGLCLPRLLWGLAGAAIFGHALGLGVSAAAGVLTLAALLIPIMTSGFNEGLSRAMERHAAPCRALGYSEQQILMHVVVPAAWPSLTISILLAGARAFGDAAALVLTAGFSSRLIESWDSSGSTLAVYVYMLAVEIGGGLPTAAAAAFVLLLLTITLQLLVVVASRP
ncbi:ABC transporter permease subunit [Puniceibacterium sediminis]|uniref:Phosphate ABC transporter membrane protein 2, PhoT family n=1 Tax=Puniceibacterium sediminis TaxID=1608407 RepID=A0A238ZX10_9RHOB|nr:ABC transporter permease subunit [Puniceibacterium sediminis]SNR87986.1 phosphate ABC transporter membrane protein 2, PhoT family [Puniceibacterium sediminis]